MKKIIIIMGIFISFIYANNKTDKSVYLEYTNKIINYNFKINSIDKIKEPFYTYYNIKNIKNPNNRKVKKRAEIILLSIFGNKAYIKINTYIGEQLISVQRKWIKKNKKILGCVLKKLTITDAYFKCNKRILHKTLNSKIPMIREKQ